MSEQALRSIAWGGRFVVLGFASGDIPRIPLNLVLLKAPVIRGFQIGTISEHMPDEYAAGERELARLVGEGLRPHVAAVFPLDQTTQAMEAILERKVSGKVIIDPTR